MLAVLFGISILTGAYLPEKIPLHWDRQGIIDRVGTKYELVFLMPAASAVIFAIGVFAESRFIRPPRKLRGFLSFMQFFFLSIFFSIQARNLLRAGNILTPIERLFSIPALLLYAYVATTFEDAEFQSIFGIKTKWTMASQYVWERTNRLASKLFQCCAGMMLLPLFFYKQFYLFLFVPPITSFIILAAYSRYISKNDPENKPENKPGNAHKK